MDGPGSLGTTELVVGQPGAAPGAGAALAAPEGGEGQHGAAPVAGAALPAVLPQDARSDTGATRERGEQGGGQSGRLQGPSRLRNRGGGGEHGVGLREAGCTVPLNRAHLHTPPTVEVGNDDIDTNTRDVPTQGARRSDGIRGIAESLQLQPKMEQPLGANKTLLAPGPGANPHNPKDVTHFHGRHLDEPRRTRQASVQALTEELTFYVSGVEHMDMADMESVLLQNARRSPLQHRSLVPIGVGACHGSLARPGTEQ